MKIASTSKHHPLHTKRRDTKIPLGAQRFLAAFEGIEGGFAIGSSIIVALMFADLSRELLLLTVVVSIVVNGFNTASVKYSSEHYLDQLDGAEKRSPFKHYFIPAFIEFVSYFAISFISVIPLIVLSDLTHAVIWSVLITLIILFVAGYTRGYMLRMNAWRDALETLILGSGIILVGLISGFIIHFL
ncbi:VIT1/CCC1 transporter family protein [Candidatus Nomurabacteria bacterium]|nr:VIT1/CCC1 transporter family protein [Candidatus Nomurabacteria bacterium]